MIANFVKLRYERKKHFAMPFSYFFAVKIFIAQHCTPTWWVASNLSHVYSLWISWWGVRLSHALVFLMRKPGMVSWVELDFILIYSSASQLTYSLIGLPAMVTRVLWIMSVLLSRCFLGIDSLVFSGTQHGVRAHMVLWLLDFLKKYFCSQKWGK